MNRNLLKVSLLLVGLSLLAATSMAEGRAVPNIIVAPHNHPDNIPAALAGNPRPLLDGDAKTIIYDLASTITDDDDFEPMESNYLWYPWYPLVSFFNPFW